MKTEVGLFSLFALRVLLVNDEPSCRGLRTSLVVVETYEYFIVEVNCVSIDFCAF